ncbi:p70 protein, partial [Genlisea aurea]
QRPSCPAATPKAIRKLKTPVSDSDSCLSPKLVASRTPKERSPKPRVTEIKASSMKSNKVSELESEVAHLQEELKMAKDQLNSSESLRSLYQLEVEEAKRKLASVSAKLDETEKQLGELSESEDARVQELRKISHDRDRVWQSELEAVQKQHAMDSAALASAINEMSRLKIQLEKTAHSEAAKSRQAEAAYAEIHTLRIELEETISLVKELREQLNDSRQSEARASAQSKQSENGEIDVLRNEVSDLRIALKGAERMYHEEYIQSTLDIRNAYGLLEQAKSDFLVKESALRDQLREAQ